MVDICEHLITENTVFFHKLLILLLNIFKNGSQSADDNTFFVFIPYTIMWWGYIEIVHTEIGVKGVFFEQITECIEILGEETMSARLAGRVIMKAREIAFGITQSEED